MNSLTKLVILLVAVLGLLAHSSSAAAFPSAGYAAPRGARYAPRRQSYETARDRNSNNDRRNPYAVDRPDKDESTFYVPA